MEILRTPCSGIREQNSVCKEFLEIVANGQCVKEDNCSFRHEMNKRGKVTPSNPSPNSFMQQNHREPEVPEEEVPVVECLDGLASTPERNLQ